MKKEKLILLPLCASMVFLFYSWYLSYPLSIDSPVDFIFNHISSLYWIGLPILLLSLYVITTKIKHNLWKWVITVGIVMSMYSLFYFYYLIPGPDAHYFRGLTEYFIITRDLDPLKPHHDYYQCPLFFILNQVVCCLLGLELIYVEFVLFTIIGLLLVTALYIYTSSAYRNSGYIAVIAFFMIMYDFLNYQWAPFSLATGLLFLLFMLDTHSVRSRVLTLSILIIFTSITLMHAFVAVFFIFYTLLRYIVSRNEMYKVLFLLTLIIYLVVLIYNTFYFELIVPKLFLIEKSDILYTWARVVQRTFSSSSAPTPPLDAIAQMLSRTVVITTTTISVAGFIILLMRRKLRHIDYALFLSGVIYAVAGVQFPILGHRSLSIITIPISLGASYFGESRFRIHFKCLFLVLMILFAFIPLHRSFFDIQIHFQTKEAYESANFVIDHYNWNKPSLMLTDFRLMNYLQTRSSSNVISFEHDFSSSFPRNIETHDCIVYTVGLEKSFLRHNLSLELQNKFNIVFNSGFTSIAMKANSSL